MEPLNSAGASSALYLVGYISRGVGRSTLGDALQWNNHRKSTDTHTSHETTAQNVGRPLCTCLGDDADEEDGDAAHRRQFTPQTIS